MVVFVIVPGATENGSCDVSNYNVLHFYGPNKLIMVAVARYAGYGKWLFFQLIIHLRYVGNMSVRDCSIRGNRKDGAT